MTTYQYDSTQGHDIMVVRGVTDNSATSGAMTLSLAEAYDTGTYLDIPDGCQMEILEMRVVNGATASQFTLDVSYDSGSNWKEVLRMLAAASTEDDTTFRKPKVIRALFGGERIRIAWAQTSAVLSYAIVTFRFVPITADD